MTALRPVKPEYVGGVIADVMSQAGDQELDRHVIAVIEQTVHAIMRTPSAITHRALVDVLESQGVLQVADFNVDQIQQPYMSDEGGYQVRFFRRLSVVVKGW